MRLKWHGLWGWLGRGLEGWAEGSRDALIQISRSLTGGRNSRGLASECPPGAAPSLRSALSGPIK